MESNFINIIILFFLSFTTTCISVPLVIKLAHKQKLYDKVDERKVHQGSIPRLGGVAIVLGCLISQLYFILEFPLLINESPEFYYYIFSAMLVFIIGFIDDTNWD